MSEVPHVVFGPSRDVTREAELKALAAIYRRAIARFEEQKAAGTSGGEDAKAVNTKEGGRHALEKNVIHSTEGARHDMRRKNRHGSMDS